MASDPRSGRARGGPGRVLGVSVVLAIVAAVLVFTDDRLVPRDDRPPDGAGIAPPIPIGGGGPRIDPAGPTAPTTGGAKAGDVPGRRPASRPPEPPARPGPAPPPDGPDGGLVSDFDGDQVQAAFGSGWSLTTDLTAGGHSTAAYRIVPRGADGSKGALQIAGVIEDRPQPRWAGALYSPGPRTMSPTNLTARKAVSFQARGDGRTYTVTIYSISRGFAHAEQTFVAGKEWRKFRFEFKDFATCEPRTFMGLLIGGGPDVGPFELFIDDVRFE